MKSLLRYFKGYIREACLGPFFKLLEALVELAVPLIIAYTIDNIIPHRNQNALVAMFFVLSGLALFGVTVAVIAQYVSSKVAIRFTQALTNDLFAKVMRLTHTDRDRLTAESLITRLSSDTFQLQTGINLFLRLFLRSPIVVVGATIMAFTIHPQMTLSFIIMVGILFVLVFSILNLATPAHQALRQTTDQLVKRTREQMTGMRVIRAFHQESREQSEFEQVNQAYYQQQIRLGYLTQLISPLTFLVVNLTLIAVLWQGQIAIHHQTLNQGMLVALVNYLLQILAELIKAAMLVNTLHQSFISAQRIQAVFDLPTEDLETPLSETQTTTTDLALVVDQLSFTYPGASQAALQHIHFTLKQGELLGIIGGTGAGKTTLTKLMLQLYQPSAGQLTFYHAGQMPATLAEGRQTLRIVPQKAELFKGTVRSNLCLGQTEPVSDAMLWQALEIAQATEFIKDKGLDTPVAAFGQNFSGGQRQRLTIARALVKTEAVLILDDATSALDYLTEARLLQAIRAQRPQTTLILISQRTNSLKTANQILVLDQGHQVGWGNHIDLLDSNPVYQAIHHSQHTQKGGEHA